MSDTRKTTETGPAINDEIDHPIEIRMDFLVDSILHIPDGVDVETLKAEFQKAIDRRNIADEEFANHFGRIHPLYHAWMDG